MNSTLETNDPKTPSPGPGRKATKSIPVKVGNCRAKIYRIKNTVSGRVYEQFTLAYSEGGRRVLKKFSDLEAAKAEANLVLTKLANGEAEVLKMTALDRAAYIQSVEKLRPLNLPLNEAVGDYVSAVTRLPSDVRLRDVVDFYLKRHPTGPSKTVREVVDEILKAKGDAKRSDVYLKDLESRLGQFAEAFSCPLVHVAGPTVEEYLRSLGLSGRSQNNHLRVIKGMFRYAVKRGYLPKDWSELDAVEMANEDEGEIEVFTAGELRVILNTARPEIIPWLAIGAFAGLRHAELQRLDWSEIHLAERFIEVKAEKAKTASRRTVPITDNLAAWLSPYAMKTGRVTAFENMSKQITEFLAPKAGITWKHNGLRHSFISYRVEEIKDVAKVALEAGNSPQMIFSNYRQLVTESQAKSWFAIVPETASNVVPMLNAVAAS